MAERKKISKRKTSVRTKKRTPESTASEKLYARAGTEPAGLERSRVSEDLKRQMVEEKAYELFQRRGYLPGDDMSDWFAAERLVQEELERREPETPGKTRKTRKKGRKM